MIKPKDCLFNIIHDPDLGYYAVVVEENDMEINYFAYNKDISRIVPIFFYKLQDDSGNTYGFSVKPEEARDALKRMGFREDLELI